MLFLNPDVQCSCFLSIKHTNTYRHIYTPVHFGVLVWLLSHVSHIPPYFANIPFIFIFEYHANKQDWSLNIL